MDCHFIFIIKNPQKRQPLITFQHQCQFPKSNSYFTFINLSLLVCFYNRSIGCTIVEMLTTKPPFSQFEPMTAIYNIGAGRILPHLPVNVSESLFDLMQQCFKRDPRLRPSAADLLNHPFFKKERIFSTMNQNENLETMGDRISEASEEDIEDIDFENVNEVEDIETKNENIVYEEESIICNKQWKTEQQSANIFDKVIDVIANSKIKVQRYFGDF